MNSTTSIILLQRSLYRFGGPILLALCGISCILNSLVFIKKFQHVPSATYLISFNIASFLFIYTSLMNGTLTAGYGLDVSLWNLVYCRVRIYVSLVADFLAPYFLILASIDRVLFTSSSASVRLKSTHRFAFTSILIGTIIVVLLHTHALYFTQRIQMTSSNMACYHKPGLYTKLIAYYMLMKAIIVPMLLVTFGIWTIKNIRCSNRTRFIRTIRHHKRRGIIRRSRTRSKQYQIFLMLLADIIGYVCFCSFPGIFLMYFQLTQYIRKSDERIHIEIFARYISLFLTYIPYCINCYVHIVISRTFRKEIRKLLCGRVSNSRTQRRNDIKATCSTS